MHPESEQLQDHPKNKGEELTEVNLVREWIEAQPIFIIATLSADLKQALLGPLEEFKDAFAWEYAKMSRLVQQLVTINSISQKELGYSNKSWGTKQELEMHIKQEIQKLLEFIFIKPIQHSTWLTNTVSVKKQNGQIHWCIDFYNLNKACMEDKFPLPNIDILVNATATHSITSFIDDFNGQNDINMHPLDAKKTVRLLWVISTTLPCYSNLKMLMQHINNPWSPFFLI